MRSLLHFGQVTGASISWVVSTPYSRASRVPPTAAMRPAFTYAEPIAKKPKPRLNNRLEGSPFEATNAKGSQPCALLLLLSLPPPFSCRSARLCLSLRNRRGEEVGAGVPNRLRPRQPPLDTRPPISAWSPRA